MSQPREGDTFRSLYLPQSFYETSVDRNGLHPGYPQPYYTQAHPSENHSITPTSDMSPPSRFSPTTPTVGKGRGFDLERGDQTSLGSSRGAECQCRHEKRNFRNTILLAALAVLMLVVISNVIFLDVRLMTNSNNSVNPINNTATMPNNSRPSATTSPSRSLSSTGLPSPTANNNVVAAPPSATHISSGAAVCISQILPGVTPPQNAASYCSQCLPALKNIPQDWFVGQANNGSQGQANLQALSNAADFCNNVPSSVLNGPAPQTTA